MRQLGDILEPLAELSGPSGKACIPNGAWEGSLISGSSPLLTLSPKEGGRGDISPYFSLHFFEVRS